jgi:hypothetical protein
MLRCCLLFLAVAIGTVGAVAGAEDLPFWKAKEKIYSRIQDGEVIVSVKSAEPRPPMAHRVSFAGGGQAKVPRDFLFGYARDFEKMALMSGAIDKAAYHKDTGTMDAHVSSFGYHADMVIAIQADEGDPKKINFEILKGPVKGMRGSLHFTSLAATKSEVGMNGEYGYDKFPLPKFFLEFGMEVVLQKMAVRLRNAAEKAFRETPK